MLIDALFYLSFNKIRFFGFGPKITPPPFHKGERFEPARARPVPFCFHGFRPPPLTSLRVFVDTVPCLLRTMTVLKDLYVINNYLMFLRHLTLIHG
jgi:hypothetical protein